MTRLPETDDELLALAAVEAPGPPAGGLFRDGCWLRRVSGESVVLFGGGRALLLEVAHPLVAEGVAEHSNFRSHPYDRLRRTLDAMGAITFGTRAEALASARAVERAHERVRGTLREACGRFPAGTPYSGRDPELVRWVWATLADTALAVYERFVAPVHDAAREAYYADHRAVARLLGVPPALVPRRWSDFRAYFDGMLESDVLAVGAVAREIGAAVIDPPGGLAGAGMVRLITASLLPTRLREAFGLRWDEERAARLERLIASVRSLRRTPTLDSDGDRG